jgi:hypothetical protein
MAAISSRANEHKPDSPASNVLASITLLGPKEVGDVTLNAPPKPGKNPYICS